MPSGQTNVPLRFDEIAAAAPDLDDLGRQVAHHKAALAREPSLEGCLAILREWDNARREVETYRELVCLRFEQDTGDAERKAAREAWDAVEPRWTELEVEMKRALLEHPLRPELEQETGPQAFALWESDCLAFDPALKEDLARESALGLEYTELLASAKLSFAGEDLTLSTITKHYESADRATRHGADLVLWKWFEENGAQLDRIFDDMLRLRTGMATGLGYANFVELGYRRMNRVDYDERDVERLRAAVVEEVVPLTEELRARQGRDLGVDPLMAWDSYVHDLRGNPLPQGDGSWMVAQAREMFKDMGSGLGSFFDHMATGGFLDLESRPRKSGGGFCTTFSSYGMPFVFSNFNGTKGDVEVLTHEVGHAFQAFCSRDLFPVDYQVPTLDAAEVHSMGLEFLTWPYMQLFFGEEAQRFRSVHLTESLLFLAYGTAVDHFQHLVYERPDASPAERHGMWQEMERTYLPWLRWGDLDYPAKGGRWQRQRHIYLSPFYYIDYVLAQTCALQLWARAEEDRAEALESYVALCARGGSAPFQELVRSAGLVSPFDEGCLASVVRHARRVLGL